MKNDVENYWLQATSDLAQYAAKEIQIRFLLATLDSIDNDNGEGWLIDDVEIIQESLPACNDGNDSSSTAELINFDQTLAREICPSGDIEYYKFDGLAGDHIVLDIDTQTSAPVDNLDLFLFLLDGDTRSELAQHDDEVLGTVLDPHLGYQIKRSGTYYVRAKLWSHPSHGGENFDYEITLTKDNNPPQGYFTQPQLNSYINNSGTFELTINASDGESGISYVEFLYHSGDWEASDWQVIDADHDGTDGWGITLDANDFPEEKGAAFFANIYDWAGNWAGTGVWEIGFDRTPPDTDLLSLGPDQQSTAFQLEWTGSDNLSGIDYYQMQSKTGGGNWSNLLPNPTATQTNMWFVGQTGTDYSFRMRGIDHAGNLENFPEIPESNTSIPDASVICSSPDTWDSDGNDNSPENSINIGLLDPPTMHNFCNPLAADRLQDEDWVYFEVENGQAYLIESQPLAPETAS
ncbi:MAG: fibronectin type III domain-containing protein, partial [Anaerolineales bacterium]|nr:fibronectin type III domain-containing protein [Anaerolineales bacterium]